MEVGDWITLAAVIVALGIGVASILHTRSMQKKERKERLLNEIIEWATEFPKFFFTMKFEYIQNAKSEEKLRLYLFARFAQDLNILNALIGRDVYILNISSSFGINLRLTVQRLIEDLLSYREYFNKWFKILENNSFDPKREDFDKAVEFENRINTSALDVIQEATKLKTEGIK